MDNETRKRLVAAKEKYGDNHWWESKDPKVIGMYQLFEDILFVDFNTFHEGITKLLDRPVFTHEFGLNRKGLEGEARIAMERMKRGVGLTEEQKASAVQKSIQMLEDFCERTGKGLIKVKYNNGQDTTEN